MTRYQYTRPLQEPYTTGYDETGRRVVVTFDVASHQEASTTTLADLGALLQAAGVGTVGTSILFTSRVSIPDAPTVVLRDLGGVDVSVQEQVHRFRQCVTRVEASALTLSAAKTLAWQAYHALEVVHNQDV